MINDVLNALRDLYLTDFASEKIEIQSRNSDISYHLELDSNFEDRSAFVTGMSRFIEETSVLNNLFNLVEEGMNVHFPNIYSWRSISKTLPPATLDAAARESFNTAVFNVFNTEIELLEDFYDYVNERALPDFSAQFAACCKLISGKTSVSPGIISMLARMIDAFYLLDMLKDSKTSLKNDFSTFKRYLNLLSGTGGATTEDVMSSEKVNLITLFLARNNQIMALVRSEIDKWDMSAELLIEIITTNCGKIENGQYAGFDERISLIRSILSCLFLLDTGSVAIYKLESKKKVAFLARCAAIFKDMPSVPVFGDMHLDVVNYLNRLRTLEPNGPGSAPASSANLCVNMFTDIAYNQAVRQQFNMTSMLAGVEPTYFRVLSDIGQIRSSILNSNSLTLRYAKSTVPFREHSGCWNDVYKVFTVIKNGFGMLSRLTEIVMSLHSFKMTHPISDNDPRIANYCRANNTTAGEIEAYDKLTRFNFDYEEKSAYVRIIAYIKSLYSLLLEMENIVTPTVNSYIYMCTQSLLTNSKLVDLMNKVSKSSKNELLKMILTSLKDTIVDSSLNEKTTGLGTNARTGGGTNKKRTMNIKNLNVNEDMTGRTIGLLSTQLYMAQALLSTVINTKDYNKELGSSLVTMISDYLKNIPTFVMLSNYSESLRKISNLGALWFREFYIEITVGKCIQFPIDTSIPWILVSHVIDSADPSLIESLLYILDIYNDATEISLTYLKRRYMYDELEAEANLIFEQLLHKLAERIYSHYRALAGTILLKKSVKSKIITILKTELSSLTGSNYKDKSGGNIVAQATPNINDQLTNVAAGGAAGVNSAFTSKGTKNDPLNDANVPLQGDNRYSVFFEQKSVHLLGREINLSQLLSQRLILSIKKSLDVAIKMLEANPLSAIVEFDQLLEISRITHKLLLRSNASVPAFELLYKEVNNCHMPNAISKVTMYVLSELIKDFLPNFCYSVNSNKFVMGRRQYSDEVKRPKTPTAPVMHFFGTRSLTAAISSSFAMYRNFFGHAHFVLLVKHLGYSGVGVLVDQLTQYACQLVTEKFSQYMSLLKQGMPQRVTLPRFSYGFAGNVKYLLANFQGIFKYRDLNPVIFQCMREIGNTFIFIYCLENAMKADEMQSLNFNSIFMGVLPSRDISYLTLNVNNSKNIKTGGLMFESSTENTRLFGAYGQKDILENVIDVLESNKYNGTGASFDYLKTANTSVLFHNEKLTTGLSFFASMLHSVQLAINSQPESNTLWNPPIPKNAAVAIDECNDLHRIFSVLYLAMAFNNCEGEEICELTFGDSLVWCMASLVVLTDKADLAEGLDFVDHVLRVAQYEELTGMSGGKVGTGVNSGTGTSKKNSGGGVAAGELPTLKLVACLESISRRKRLVYSVLSEYANNKYNETTKEVRCFSAPKFG